MILQLSLFAKKGLNLQKKERVKQEFPFLPDSNNAASMHFYKCLHFEQHGTRLILAKVPNKQGQQ